MILLGTIVNSAAIIVGSVLGVLMSKLLAKAERFEKITDAIMKAVGLCVIYIGISGVISGIAGASISREMGGIGNAALLVMIGSIVIGTLIGEVVDIDKHLNRFGGFIEAKLTRGSSEKQNGGLAKGFVAATLLFCVGAMAITGSIESGLSDGQNQATLYAKSALDLVSSVVFGATLGIGSALSAISVFVYQGAIEILALFLGSFLPSVVISEMSATGSLIIFGLGLNLLGITKLKIANMLPAIFLPLLVSFFV